MSSAPLRDEHLPLRRGRSRFDTDLSYRVRREISHWGKLVVSYRGNQAARLDNPIAWSELGEGMTWSAAIDVIRAHQAHTAIAVDLTEVDVTDTINLEDMTEDPVQSDPANND